MVADRFQFHVVLLVNTFRYSGPEVETERASETLVS
jgi:hypothetical protein